MYFEMLWVRFVDNIHSTFRMKCLDESRMAHPPRKELLQRRQRPTQNLEPLRDNVRCPIIAASLRADGSMLANIDEVACLAPVEVAP